MAFANLHIHTCFSDGMTHPNDLAGLILNEQGLTCFSITDHDSMSAIEPFFRVMERHKDRFEKTHKRFIPGVELSLNDAASNATVHLIGLYPLMTAETVVEQLERIDSVLGDFCRYRGENRGVKDLDARICRAFEVNLDGIADRFDGPETVIQMLRKRASAKIKVCYEQANKFGDVIQHPIPMTYQTIIDHWVELVPTSTREKITLYTLRSDSAKVDRLARIYVAEGMAPEAARQKAEENQATLLKLNKSAVKELSVPEGFSMLKASGAVIILAHPAADHQRIGYADFDHHVTEPLIAAGLDGIEVYYPYDASYRREAIARYTGIARDRNLLISGGTDFHGDGRTGLSDVKLGEADALKIIG